jgi:hypothetical protein
MGSVELTRPLDTIREQVVECIVAGETLLQQVPTDDVGLGQFREQYLAWESRTPSSSVRSSRP